MLLKGKVKNIEDNVLSLFTIYFHVDFFIQACSKTYVSVVYEKQVLVINFSGKVWV